ncbi:MAG: hypothetical protein WAK55_17505 [Xanthobacteraceae bacterium]
MPAASKPTDLDYDAKIVWELFAHNKNSTLDYGWIRNKVIRANGKVSNDRQNAALNLLESKDLIEKVSHGRWRYKKPERPSAPVVASAPATPEEAGQVVPRFTGAMTDLVYSLLRERLPNGLTAKEIYTELGIDVTKDRNNCSASLQGLEKTGWLDIDRKAPRKSIYFARIVNKLGKAPPGLRHVRAQALEVPVVETPAAPAELIAAPAAIEQQAPAQQARTFTLEQVRHYGELKAARGRIQHEINEFCRPRLAERDKIDAELRDVYGEG